MKKTIEIPVSWRMYGSYYIEVDENATKEEIANLARDHVFNMATPLPADRFYFDDSMTIDDDDIYYLEEVE